MEEPQKTTLYNDLINQSSGASNNEYLDPQNEKQSNDQNELIECIADERTTSRETIFNLTTCMLGSSLIVIPIQFYQSGLISSLLVCILVAFFSYRTCRILVHHSLPGEKSLVQSITRILGVKWGILFNLLSGILLYVAGIIYFLLISNLVYRVVQNLSNNSLPPSSTIDFNQMSFQFIGIILIILYLPMLYFKDLGTLLKINNYGVYITTIYSLFIIYLGIDAIARGNLKFTWNMDKKNDVPLLGQVITIFGIFALSFTPHNMAIEVLKKNQKPQNDKKNLRASFVITIIIYLVIGVLGTIGISWRDRMGQSPLPNTVLDVFTSTEKNYEFYLVVGAAVLILLQLGTILPIVFFFARTQLLTLFNGHDKQIPTWQIYAFNLLLASSCLVCEIFDFSPSKVIAFDGAICGYFLVYVIPILMHFKCLYPKLFSFYNRPTVENPLAVDQSPLNPCPTDDYINDFNCNDHAHLKSKKSIYLRITFYMVILLTGTFTFVITIYELSTSIFQKSFASLFLIQYV